MTYMRTGSLVRGPMALLGLLMQLHIASAAPPDGYHWIDRSTAYAEAFCAEGYENLEYGVFQGHDCANFTSQCLNAGCSGLAELNNTNWDGWPQGGDCDCNSWMSHEAEGNYQHDCNPGYFLPYDWSPSQLHHILSAALEQSWWAYCSDTEWPFYNTHVDSDAEIPDWVQAGCVAYFVDGGAYHAFFIAGNGTGANALVYAHTNYHCGEVNMGWMVGPSGGSYVEVYGPRSYSEAQEDKQ